MAEQKKTKTRKTPAELAQERLGVAQRRLEAVQEKLRSLKAEVAELERNNEQALARRDYLALDPALPKTGEVLTGDIEPCPECKAGKHINCTHEVPDGDETATCPCEAANHEETSA